MSSVNRQPKLTKPHSPTFSTDNRIQLREKPLPSDEIEYKEIQSKNKFKARPFNKKIFENSGKLGIP